MSPTSKVRRVDVDCYGPRNHPYTADQKEAALLTRPRESTLKVGLGLNHGTERRDVVGSMRGVVNEVLRTWGFRDQWPDHVPVARGIVDLVAKERQQ